MQKSRMIKLNIFVIVAMLFVNIFSSLLGMTTIAFAEETVYSDVMEDLQRDETFSIDDYPADSYNNSLQVIQIAESADKELFIYVYQPSGQEGDLRATSINISTDNLPTNDDDELSFMNYSLEYLNSYYTLFKYKVQNFEVSDAETRYYNISSIYRAWDENLDDPTGNDNTISEKAFAVGKFYTLETIDGETVYSCTSQETVEITDKYVGSIRYTNGFVFHVDACDSHYVAFSTDRRIEKLLEADVTYLSQSFELKGSIGGGMIMSIANETSSDDKYEYGEVEENYVTLRYDEFVEVREGWLVKKEYSWNRIQSIDEFVTNLDEEGIELTETTLDNLESMQWVLRFAETDYNYSLSVGTPTPTQSESGTIVTDVTILRLKFEVDGKVYNLGVIDDKTSSDNIPDNDWEGQGNWFVWLIEQIANWFNSLALILKILVCVVLALLAIVVLYFIFKFFAWLIEGINKLFKK